MRPRGALNNCKTHHHVQLHDSCLSIALKLKADFVKHLVTGRRVSLRLTLKPHTACNGASIAPHTSKRSPGSVSQTAACGQAGCQPHAAHHLQQQWRQQQQCSGGNGSSDSQRRQQRQLQQQLYHQQQVVKLTAMPTHNNNCLQEGPRLTASPVVTAVSTTVYLLQPTLRATVVTSYPELLLLVRQCVGMGFSALRNVTATEAMVRKVSAGKVPHLTVVLVVVVVVDLAVRVVVRVVVVIEVVVVAIASIHPQTAVHVHLWAEHLTRPCFPCPC